MSSQGFSRNEDAAEAGDGARLSLSNPEEPSDVIPQERLGSQRAVDTLRARRLGAVGPAPRRPPAPPGWFRRDLEGTPARPRGRTGQEHRPAAERPKPRGRAGQLPY